MAAAAVLVLALTGCSPAKDNGDGTVTMPWWYFWQTSNQTTHTETRYVPAPGPRVDRTAPRQAPAPLKAPAPPKAPVRTK